MKKNILLRTNVLVCLIIVAGFLVTAVLSYRANYSTSLENIEQVSSLTSEGIYYQMTTTFTKPVNISLTMANDSLLKELLAREDPAEADPAYVEVVRGYLEAYRVKYGYDSVFLVSEATKRYYNFNGLDRVLLPEDPENVWYYDLAASDAEYTVVVDNDEVAGADNNITVFVNCKLPGENGAMLGTVGVGLRIADLQRLLQSYQEEFGVNAYLVDRAGGIEVSSQHTGYESVDLAETGRFDGGALARILDWQAEGGASSFWTGRQESYVVTRYLPELDWHLVVEQDTGGLVADLNRQLTLTLLVILLIIAVILYVITHVIRSFNRQIVTLTQAIEQERRDLFQTATEQMFENIYELDITHNRPANQATAEYFQRLGAPPGASYDECLRVTAEQEIKEEFRQGYLDTFSRAHAQAAFAAGQDSLRYEFMISQDGADYYWMRITARLIQLESDGSLHMFTYRQNIDAEKRQERKMLLRAQTDEMTGLLTKTATQRAITQALAAAPGGLAAFLILDIDRFKEANDQFGHAFGDAVIVSCAETVRALFRRDDLIGRIGGDEFAVFLSVPDRAWVEERARALSAALDRVHEAEGRRWALTASIGISLAPDHGGDFESLYRHADAALYQTKARGRNGWTIYDGPPL